MTEANEHLRGPWKAYLVTFEGDAYASLDEVPDGVGPATAVLRGSALPVDGRLPDDGSEEDVLFVLGPDEFHDWARQLPARWAQAQAVAAGLNERAGLSSSEPGA